MNIIKNIIEYESLGICEERLCPIYLILSDEYLVFKVMIPIYELAYNSKNSLIDIIYKQIPNMVPQIKEEIILNYPKTKIAKCLIAFNRNKKINEILDI